MTNLAVLGGLVLGDLDEIVFELSWGLFLDGFEAVLGRCEHLHTLITIRELMST
jgi:hypothetical protein